MPLWGEGPSDLARHHFENAVKLQGSGDIPGALRHYTRALDVAPEFPDLQLYRGWAY